MKKALVSLVLGTRYTELFNSWFRPGWERYCARHEIDLIVIDQSLDRTERAQRRSPSWQKCLIHHHPAVASYDQVAWVDADIRIRPDAPDLFSEVPSDRIGAVDAWTIPTQEDQTAALDARYRRMDQAGVSYVSNRTPQEFHGNFGLDAPFDAVVQAGMIVFSPRLHGAILQTTYDRYEEKGAAMWNYEMRPLSYEIQKAGPVHWLSPKFNMTWPHYSQIYYPFLDEPVPRPLRLLRRLLGRDAQPIRRKCVESAFRNNYFLHFSNGSPDYRLLPADAG